MVRLSRAQQQQRTHEAVLAAARGEFTERVYSEATVDRIAARAELTRGAVYSNFTSKRALYLSVLTAEVARSDAQATTARPSSSVTSSVEAFARAWLERLPLRGESAAAARVALRSVTGVVEEEPLATTLAQTMQLEALLLALALEQHEPTTAAGRPRQVRRAELVLTLLNGATTTAETAPGFGDPFDVVRACQHLATIHLDDTWAPPHLPYIAPATPDSLAWSPPPGLRDEITGRAIDLARDGVVMVLGSHRLGAAEEAVRAARRRDHITLIATAGHSVESAHLIRLRLHDLSACLRRSFPAQAWPRLHVAIDDHTVVPPALELVDIDDNTETAVRIHDGTIIARAHGPGAAHAAAAATARPQQPHDVDQHP